MEEGNVDYGFLVLNIVGVFLFICVLFMTLIRVRLFGIPNYMIEALALVLIGYSYGRDRLFSFRYVLLVALIAGLLGFVFDPFLFSLLFAWDTTDPVTWLGSGLLAIVTTSSTLLGYGAGYLLHK
jgi:hypothetical protein